MKIWKVYFLICFTAIMVQGCSKPGCFEDAGSVSRVPRSAAPFSQIKLYDNINLILTQDTTEAIAVEAGAHLLPNIFTTVENNILTIENKASCAWLRAPGEKINVYVSVKNLQKLLYNASGHVSSTNTLIGDNIQIISEEGAGNVNITLEAGFVGAYIHHENADFTLKGHANVCFSYINARGSINFENLEVNTMNLEYGSVRDATIYVKESLSVILYHTGNLYYKGRPTTVQVQSHSTGRLFQLP